MPKPTLEQRDNFKTYLRYYKDKFANTTIPFFFLDEIVTEVSAGISTSDNVKVIVFDNYETIDITESVNSKDLLYIPALFGDTINFVINDSTYEIQFFEESGVEYEGINYYLDDAIDLGNNRLIIRGLGGALLEPVDGPSYEITQSSTLINEGQSVTFIITTENVPDDTALYYTTIGTVSAADFTDNSLIGLFFISETGLTSGEGTITRIISNDLTTEGTENFQLQIRTGSTSGPIVATSSTVTINDTSLDPPDPVYSVGVSTSVLDEGQSISFNITAENVSSGTELYYTISGTANSNDFTDNTLSGSFSVIDFGNGIPTGTVTKTIAIDLITEGTETFVFQVRTGSISGPIVATSSTVTINDTNPTFTITPSSISINESQSVTFSVQTTKIPNGTQLYFTTIGNITSSDFTDNSLSGTFAIIGIGGDNGTGAFTRTTTFDVLSTQNKNFQVQIRINSITGTIVGISSTVTINNVTATFSITPSATIINEGDTVTFNISSNVPNGTVIYYTTAGDVSASDFTDNLLSGSVTINSGTATITKITTRDRKTEGDQSFALQLRFGSVSGSVLTTSSFVTIKDTSRNVGENANGLTFGPVQVNRDNGNQQLVSDWYSICDIDSLPEGSKIALFIDTSGSMTQATIQASYDLLLSKLSEKNITIITVTNPNEDWITPFLTELD
jgi:hypothetical protein